MEADRTEVVSSEVFLNAAHGYHVHGELVGREGTAAMTAPALTRANRTGQGSFAFPDTWVPRFAQACRDQMQGWVRSVVADGPMGDSAWDGYAATAVTEQVASGSGRGEVRLSLPERPALHAQAGRASADHGRRGTIGGGHPLRRGTPGAGSVASPREEAHAGRRQHD